MRGRWIYEEDRRNHWHCSECGHTVGQLGHTYNFCPICGADMREEQEPLQVCCVKKGYTFTDDGLIDGWTKVIFCKDCEYWDTSWNTQNPDEHFCTMMDAVVGNVEFCARAARREEKQ